MDGRFVGGIFWVVGAVADVLVVPAEGGLFAVGGARVGVRMFLGLTGLLARVVLDGAAGVRLTGGGTASSAVEGALLAGVGLLASE